MRLRINRLIATTAAVLFCTGTSLFAADAARPSVECLPEDTVLMVRMPNGQKYVDAMRAQTKLGRVLLSKDRIDNAFKQMKEKKPDSYAKAEKELAKYGLKVEEMKDLLTGDSGFAVSMKPPTGKGESSPGNAFFWVEPQGDLGPKLYTAMQKAVEQAEGEEKPKRTDIKIEGVDVMKLVTPTYTTQIVEDEVPANFAEMTDADRDKWMKEQEAKRANPKKTKTGETTTFVALLNKRVIAMAAIPANQSGSLKPGKPVSEEESQAAFGAYLKSHLASGKASGFTDKMNSTPGMQENMPTGVVGVDGYFDASVVIKIAAAVPSEDPARDPAKMMQAMGLDGLGPIVFRSVLADTLVKSNAFMSTPGPRKGLLTLLDQPELPPVPAAWATSTLASYIHWSFDLAKAYAVLKEVATQIQGPEADQNFQMVEAQAQAMLKKDVAGILASLGVQHTVGLYPTQPARAKPIADAKPAADEEPESPATQQPFATVWSLTDQAVWTQIMQTVTPFVAQPGGNVVPANEQGFTGFRTGPNAPTEGAILTGKNLLVVGVGPKVTEQTLSALNTPPVGEASLKEGKAYARAKTLVKLRPSMLFGLAGNEKASDQLLEGLISSAEAMLKEGPNANKEEAEAILEIIKALLPKPEELQGAYGVGVTQGYNTPKGVVVETVSEFPKD